MSSGLGSANLRVEVFMERLICLENTLQCVKCHLPSFYEHISAMPVKRALQKVVECIPPNALTVSRRNNDPAGAASEEQAKIDFLMEKFSHNEESANDAALMRRPMRYTTLQNYAQSDAIKVGKVLLKTSKSPDLSECNQDHANNRTIQAQILNSGRTLQKSLQLLTALEEAARCFEETPNTPVLKEEIVSMVRHLKISVTNLLRGITQLNSYRQIARILAKLRQRGTMKALLTRIEEEKGKKKVWSEMFSIDHTSVKEDFATSRHSIIEGNLYDDSEACVGSLVNRSYFPLEMSTKKDTFEVYSEFNSAWKQLEEEPLALAEKYSLLTSEYLAALPSLGRRSALSFKNDYESCLVDAVDLERSTWRLIHALYSDRLCHTDSLLNKDLPKLHYHSEKDIVNTLYDTDDDLRETQVIVDWLEGKVREEIVKVAEKYECLFNETTVWESTHHLLETLSANELKSKHLVTHLFPDTALIGGGGLAQKDISAENRYLHYLFLCVRGGDLQRAQRLCLQRGDITRAVAMEGWRPFHTSCLSKDSVQPKHDAVEGNATRVLSKCVAWWNSENPALNPYERAMFAAQSGNLSMLLRAMTSGSWEDLLWAHCRALVESRVDATLRMKIDCGPRADTLSVLGRPQKGLEVEDVGLQLPNSAWLPGSWTLSEAFSKAETVLGWCPISYLFQTVEGDSGFVAPALRPSEISAFLHPNETNDIKASSGSSSPSSRHTLLKAMFYAICRGVALREYSELLTAVALVAPLFIPASIREILASGITNVKWPDQLTLDELDCQVLRFLSHFVLCLRHLETGLPDEPCNAVLETYVITLIVERRFSLVASYIAQLSSPVRQTRWYASFLSSLKRPEECRQCLEYAEVAGLNVQSITRAVIRIVRRRFDEREGLVKGVSNTSIPLPTPNGITDLVGGDVVAYLTQVDKARIAALDWLTHDQAQRGELLVLTNSLIRLFIAMRKLRAARALLDRLPLALLDQLKLKLLQAEEDFGVEVVQAAVPPWLANTVREHEALILYLHAREAFDQWYVRINSEKPTPPAVNSAGVFGSLAERVAAEEAEKNFKAHLECWNHEVELSTSSLVRQLESLLTYESPGWLVDAAVLHSNATTSEFDVTGMFSSAAVVMEQDEEGGTEELGIAGLGDSPHSRKLQMIILRETCLREVVFMLIKVFKLTGRHAECVRLADLVANSQFGIFKLFNECQMQTLLEQLQESMLHLQETCGDALGYSEN
ncbi:Nuclear pore complex protein [Echinococcus granulosus]|nr:Nuclear pore complex protein [Echinococcus granulosus]